MALTGALGSGLVNTLYIFDEPTVGLHPQDGHRLVAAVTNLRDQGNTVIVVEHDSAVLTAADWLVDIGPGAGEGGGRIVYQGAPAGVAAAPESATGAYLGRRATGSVGPKLLRQPKDFLTLIHASGHNLKGIDVRFPLGVLCVVTGVSGAGKSTLVRDTLYPALRQLTHDEALTAEPYSRVEGAGLIQDVLIVDQSPIGRSGRSNPVIYVGAFDLIRKTFAETHEAKTRNYGPGRFSFNREGGRCNACEGNGHLTVDMQFLADVMLRCPECNGTRFRPETLEVSYRGKNIAEVLDMTKCARRSGSSQPGQDPVEAAAVDGSRARLLAAGPAVADALGRRGPAPEAGELLGVTLARLVVENEDWRNALHFRRADDGSSSRRYPQAARSAEPVGRRGP